MEQIFIYLMDGDTPVCFWKGQCTDFLNPDPGYQWLPLTCDLSVGSVTDQSKAGMIQVKMAINHKSKNGPVDFKKYDSWKKPPPKRLSSWKTRPTPAAAACAGVLKDTCLPSSTTVP